MLEIPDAQLIRHAQAFEEAALRELYHRHVQRLFRYVYARVGDHALAEDLVADVFERMLDGLPAYEERGVPFEAWLYRIAHARVIDHYRRQRVRDHSPLDERLLAAEGANPAHGATGRDELRRLWQVMPHLTPEQQQVLSLRFLAEYSLAEVAHTLEKTEGAVKALQHRALASLRRLLEKDS